MTKDLLVMITIATIVEDPDTTLVSVQKPTKEEMTHLKGEVKERNLKEICPRGNNKVVNLYFLIHDNRLLSMLELY